MTIPTKIPTPLGIFMAIVLVGGMIAMSESYFRTVSLASGSIAPTNVMITNLTDTTLSVSWVTQTPTTGALTIRSGAGLATTLFDDQDAIHAKLEKHTTHMVTYRNAQPNTDYTVTILSNGKKALDGEKPYTIHTPGSLDGASGNLSPAYGTILTQDNQPLSGALVYVTVDGGQTVAAMTKQSGTWIVPLNLVRTTDLSAYLPITDRMPIAITVRTETGVTNTVTDTYNDAPVPDMTIGRSYDFRGLNAKAPGKQIAVAPTQAPGQSPEVVLGASTVKATNTVGLTIPAQGAGIPTTLPLIQGTGIPGKTVSIVVGIVNPIGASVVVGTDGLWSYTPSQPLSPGKQSVTITTQDKTNKTIAITHMFEIFKSGTQVLGDATPSATLTLAPTASPTAVPASTLAAQTPPTSGNELPTILLLLFGFALMSGGGVLLLKE